MTATVYNLKIGEVENNILTLVAWSRKWIIALKYQTSFTKFDYDKFTSGTNT